ncbi:MAG: hypothetical protein ACOC80_00690 [Petrotogales bacterium]
MKDRFIGEDYKKKKKNKFLQKAKSIGRGAVTGAKQHMNKKIDQYKARKAIYREEYKKAEMGAIRQKARQKAARRYAPKKDKLKKLGDAMNKVGPAVSGKKKGKGGFYI